jgi:hypothetical protein
MKKQEEEERGCFKKTWHVEAIIDSSIHNSYFVNKAINNYMLEFSFHREVLSTT